MAMTESEIDKAILDMAKQFGKDLEQTSQDCGVAPEQLQAVMSGIKIEIFVGLLPWPS